MRRAFKAMRIRVIDNLTGNQFTADIYNKSRGYLRELVGEGSSRMPWMVGPYETNIGQINVNKLSFGSNGESLISFFVNPPFTGELAERIAELDEE